MEKSQNMHAYYLTELTFDQDEIWYVFETCLSQMDDLQTTSVFIMGHCIGLYE